MGQRREQAAVVPYRVRKGRLEVAVITASSNIDWILPKGGIDEGEQPWEAAAREAEEEAGLLGHVEHTALGHCRSTNRGRGLIGVYVMRVSVVLDRWPEDRLRHRRWMSPADAAAHLRPEFRRFVTLLDDRLRAVGRRSRSAGQPGSRPLARRRPRTGHAGSRASSRRKR